MQAIESYVMLFGAICGISAQTIAFKLFNRNYMKNMSVYFLFQILHFGISALIVLAYNRGFGDVRWETIVFAAVFSGFFITFFFCYSKAFQYGPLSLSTLFNSFSVLVPVFVSFVFWGEGLRAVKYIGLALLLLVFFLSSRTTSGEEGQEKKSISVKWVLFIAPAVVINGFLMVIQKWQQIITPGEEVSEFLICVFSFSCSICVAGFSVSRLVIKRREGSSQPFTPDKKFFGIAAMAGVATSFGNILIVTLASIIPSVLLFPGVQGGAVILVTIISMLVLKERISLVGKLALVLGIVAIVLLA